ncbi:hypothetical protein EHV15_35665 [Paenibacillus oralis]|uniref:Uncharacterized protein n=1 Tax=Paenibacillus oralis TaxID=2490856 RepID=A0A3P3TAJ9_9BACL|nr:hypothetical protein [Paenibacillus oralis]RRJ54912.1 hypothetical protein EHV15_35665 [Paenibacillus oralis]
MNVVTKLNKVTGDSNVVPVKEFLDFVGNGSKKREAALIAIIEGELFQNTEVAYFLAPMKTSVHAT